MIRSNSTSREHTNREYELELRRLSVGTAPVLTVALDDIDPFRDLSGPVEPQRLPAGQVERWGRLLSEAWEVLCAYDRELALAMADGQTLRTWGPSRE